MALQVWLPLTKDLRNQGLSNISVTNNGATYQSTGGKLGGCYNFDGTDDRIQISNLPNPQNITITFWMKRNATTNSRQFMFTAWNGITCELNANNTIHCYVQGSSGGHGVCDSTDAVTVDTGWIHVAYVFENGMGAKLYTNGELKKTTNSTASILWGTTSGNIGNYSNMYFNGKINDFRLYDHALSPLEVKYIAQGLILHYPLNRNGWGQDNILTNSSGYEGTSNWSGLVTVGNENGKSFLIAKRTDNSSSSRTFCTHTAITTLVSSWNVGDKFTISGYYKVPSTETYAVGGNMFIRWADQGTRDTGFTTPTTLTKDVWIRFEKVFTVPDYDTTGSVNFYLSAFSKGLSTIYWKDIKLEHGDKATPWCPAITDILYTTMGLNSTTEYDTSGFCNNGTRTGTFTWSSDMPKYNVSQYFEDYTHAIHTSMGGFVPTEITMSCWVKSSNKSPRGSYHEPLNISSTNYEISIYYNGQLRTGYYLGSTRYTKLISGTSLLDGEWHLITTTCDGTTFKSYVDAVLVDTTSVSGAFTAMNTLCIGDLNGGTTYGSTELYESDVRVYMTALSADDILALYKNQVYIDTTNNMYTYNFNETSGSLRLSPSGVMDTSEIIENETLNNVDIDTDYSITSNSFIEL